jgi:subtilisin family serine protease
MRRVVTILCFLLAADKIMPQMLNNIIRHENSLYLANRIIVKLKNPDSSDKLNEKLQQLFKKQHPLKQAERVFYNPEKLYKRKSPFSGIFDFKTEPTENLTELIRQISSLEEVEWAEPKYVRKVCFDANDEYFIAGMQKHLNVIKAAEAWNITKGKKEIVIGIVDTGVDIDHPDLAANIYLNKKEISGNGIDEDDGGEYIDDISGWDFGGVSGIPDNNPREDYNADKGYHGTHVAGIASAVTDNKFGISSIGFNCTILPVKASQGNYRDENEEPYIIYGIEGIKYAIDKGARIISCSWGGYEYSNLEQEVIDYAVSKGVLIIAAAGNKNSQQPFYPASYNGVLSVGWTNNDDTKRAAGNYGEFLDVTAPGTAVYSTWPIASGATPPFQYAGGSSMSAPLVAGLAGLVFSKYPNLTAEQVAEKIRVTCDKIDDKNLPQYSYLLGKGRINAYNAVKDSTAYSLRATKINLKNLSSGNFQSEDTTVVELEFTNFLMPVSGVKISISCKEPFVKFTKDQLEISSLSELEKIKTEQIRFVLTNDAPFDTSTFFFVKYEATGLSDFQWLPVKLNPSFVTHRTGKIEVTVTNKGGIGFSDLHNQKGSGFRLLNGKNFLNEGALMFGNSIDKLIDGVKINNHLISNDFVTQKPISLQVNQHMNKSSAWLNDNNAGASKLGIEAEISSYTFDSSSDNGYLLLNINIKNTTQKEIKNLYLGYFLDVNLSDNIFADSTAYDATGGFAYVVKENPVNEIVGAALLTKQQCGYTGINNNWHVGEVILADGFQDEEKWSALSSGIIKEKVYGDVSFVLGGGPVNISPDANEIFAFVLAPASGKEELRQIIRQSKLKYYSLINAIEHDKEIMPDNYFLSQNFPNPFNPETTISYKLQAASQVSLKVYDILGREIATLVSEYQQAGAHKYQLSIVNCKLSSGVYFYRLSAGTFVQTKKMLLLK